MTEFVISSRLLAELIAGLRAVYPEEGCGIIAGEGDRAVRLYPVENLLHSPVAYEMEPLQQVTAMLDLEADGLELLGIFHSHPGGPAPPSSTDIAQAYYPDAVQVIVSLAGSRPEVGVFRIADGRVDELSWVVVDEDHPASNSRPEDVF